MSVVDRIIEQLNSQRLCVHRAREGEYRAKCPAHSGHSDRSLSIKDAGDRVLLHCWNGCSIEDICAAIKLPVPDLFIASRSSSLERAAIQRQRQIEDGFKFWRETETLRCGEKLRSKDQARIAINDAVKAGALTTDEAMENLAPVYRGYSELEHRFETLRTGTDSEALEIYRGV